MNNDRNITVNITNRTIARTIALIVITILLYKFFGRISHGLTLVFTSMFLALALNPIVVWMGRRLKIKGRVRATAAAYFSVLAIIIIFFSFVIPPLVRQTRTFISDVPQIVDNYQKKDSTLSRMVKQYKLDEKITEGAKDFASQYSNFGSTVFDTGKRIAQAIASVLVVIIMTFMMLVEGPRWLELIFKSMPQKKRAHNKAIAQRMYKGVTGFVNGQVIMAVIAGIFAFISLEIASRIIGAEVNALALAGIVSVFALIPLFGSPLSSIVVILVSLSSSFTLGLVMAIYFIIYYFIENHTLQPYIQSRLNDLTPLTVFVAAILGIGFGGLLGAIIAIPAATTIKILVEEYFARNGQNVDAGKSAYSD